MIDQTSHVAVLIVSYNGRHDLEECLESVMRSRDNGIVKHIVVVDNNSMDDSVGLVQSRFPDVHIIASEKNIGFAAGNNLGWDWIQENCPDAEYLCLLNQDTVVMDGWLLPLIEFLRSRDNISAVQPKLLLHSERNKINTVGNRCHYLGFGFMTGYGDIDSGQYDDPARINFASGAAMVLRSSAINHTYLFNGELFMYLEDMELSWRIWLRKMEVWYIPESIVYHKYTFKSAFNNYYYIERNRWILLLAYYRIPTLFLLLPMLFVMELGQILFAIQNSILKERLLVYKYFLKSGNRKYVQNFRKRSQKLRKISDRQFLSRFSGTVTFSEIDNVLLKFIGNPTMAVYWFFSKKLIFW